MDGNGWKWLETDVYGHNLLNDLNQPKMDGINGNGWLWLDWLEMNRNGWKWMEINRSARNGWKWLEMVGNKGKG